MNNLYNFLNFSSMDLSANKNTPLNPLFLEGKLLRNSFPPKKAGDGHSQYGDGLVGAYLFEDKIFNPIGDFPHTKSSPNPSGEGGFLPDLNLNFSNTKNESLRRKYLIQTKKPYESKGLLPLLGRVASYQKIFLQKCRHFSFTQTLKGLKTGWKLEKALPLGLGRGLSAISFLLITSCTKDFKEINTNPNAPVSVQPSLLLRQVIYDYGEQMSYEGFTAGNLLGQYTTALDFNLFDRHNLKSPQLGGNPWPILYQNLRDNENILNQSLDNETFAVYEGPSRILKAYMAATLTDLFGDVPYTEAFKGKELTVTPTYDKQENIYLGEGGILDNLEKGIAAIENYSGTIPLEGDILFESDLDSWVRFANSLKIKYLMRISGKQDVATQVQALFDEANFIDENVENASFDFTDGEPNNFRLARLRIGDFNNFVLSETMFEVLSDLNDPRISTLFRPFGNSNSGEFNGLLNGIDASQTSIALADYSSAGTIFRENTGRLDANFMTSWETLFLLAEAAQRGLISANAEQLYNRAVAQAFEYWHVELPEEYLTNNAAFENGNPLENIITQKWIANIINGYEGWIEYRRTGFPELKMISASLNNNLIPARMPYPAEEEALNSTNYADASSKTDGNSINVKVWWDK